MYISRFRPTPFDFWTFGIRGRPHRLYTLPPLHPSIAYLTHPTPPLCNNWNISIQTTPTQFGIKMINICICGYWCLHLRIFNHLWTN